MAVVEDGDLFKQLATRVQAIETAYLEEGRLADPRRRLPGFFDEVWDHAAVHINQAWASHRVQAHDFALPGQTDRAGWPALQARLTAEHRTLISALAALGLPVVEVRGLPLDGTPLVLPALHLEAQSDQRFTVRRNTRRAFRLYASTVDGLPRRNVRVGVVVVRGLLHAVREAHPRRSARRDALDPGVMVGPVEITGVGQWLVI